MPGILRAAGVLALPALFLSAPAAATPDCIDYRDLPRRIGRDPLVTSAGPVALLGDRALVAGGNPDRLWVEDISDPGNPQLRGYVDLPDGPHAIAVQGDVAYVACGLAGVRIFDIPATGDPVETGHVPTLDRTRDVAVMGGFLYVADEDAGWAAFDLSDRSAPVEIAREPGRYDHLAVEGPLLVAIELGMYDFQAWDVSVPASPILAGHVEGALSCPGIPWCDTVSDLVLRSGHAYVAVSVKDCIGENCFEWWRSVRLYVWDVTDPTDLGWPRSEQLVREGLATGLALAGNRAYVSTTTGLFVADLTDPSDPVRLHGLPVGTACRGLAVRSDAGSDLAFVADAGLSVYDVTHAELPDRLGGYAVDDPMQDVAFANGLAYTVGSRLEWWPGWTNVRAWDVADPADPEVLFTSGTSGYGFLGDLEVASGDLWFSGPQSYGSPLVRSDILPGGEPGPPETVGGSCVDLEPVGPYLLVTRGNGGLDVWATYVNEPPVVVGHEGTKSAWIAADGDLAVVLQGNYSPDGVVHTLDIGDPTAPAYLAEIVLPPRFRWIDVREDLVAVGGADDSDYPDLYLLDVSDPSAPVEVGSIDLPGRSADGELLGSTLYVGLQQGGLAAVDVGDPAHPDLLGVIPTDPVSALRVTGEMLLVCEGGHLSGLPWHCLAAVGTDPPAAPSTGLRLAPNPFRDAVTIRLDLPRTTAARVDLFDAAGRHVRRLLTGAAVPELVWDGRDGAGRRVAPGVYFLRAEADGRATTTKITRLR